MPVIAAWPILLGLLIGAAPRDVPRAAPVSASVRAQSEEVRLLIAATASRSATVREMIARLGCTDVIIYVEITASPQIPTARTKLVTTVSGARFIRIGINTSVAYADRGPLLGHELQHALEIAEHENVRDEHDMRSLYASIGRSRGGDAFETDAARDVESTVRSELRIRLGE